MSVYTETRYLPILSPSRVEVDGRGSFRKSTPQRPHIFQPRVYRIVEDRPDPMAFYDPYGAKSTDQILGRIIDLYV